MVAVLLVLVVSLITSTTLVLLTYQVMKQRGRLLIRLDALEARLTAIERRTRLPGERPLSESRILRDGLRAGATAPQFSLPDIHGRTVSLQQHRGHRVLLVFTDPHCGPCDELAPDLVRLHRQNSMTLLMVGRGDTDENRRKAAEHGIDFPVVLQKRWEISKEYGIFATPVAFLIDENGVIARDVAKGRDEILALAGRS